MLLYFGVKGFLSFKDMQEMYLIPTSGARLKGTKYEHNFHLDVKNRPMKSVILFGDNASGKTNWLYALSHCVSIIRNGLSVSRQGQFHYDSSSILFRISVCNDEGREFFYELEYDRASTVQKECLKINNKVVFSFANNRLQIELSNLSDKQAPLQEIFSQKSTDTLLNKLKDWLVEPIAEFKELASKIVVKVEEPINWSMKFLPMISLEDEELSILNKYSEEVLQILEFVDPTISDISFEEMITKEGKTKFQPLVIRQVNTITKEFEIADESQGIKKIIYLLPLLLQIHDGNTVAIDELDSSIGTKSLIKIFNTIINAPVNTNGQLIVSSHNLSLLNLDYFHETQLQNFSKGKDLGSVVNGIDQYDYRSEKKNLNDIYLRGGFNS